MTVQDIFTYACITILFVAVMTLLIGLIIESRNVLIKMKRKQALIRMVRESEEMGLYNMDKINVSLYEWMEDFDNQDLYPSTQYKVQLMKAVDQYNQANGTTYEPVSSYYNYLSWKRDKEK